MSKKRKRYAGEGMSIIDPTETIFSRPVGIISRFCLKLIGRKPKNDFTLTRDFYAAITSDQSYVILGEERYGMSKRIASIKKPKPNPPKPLAK